MLVSALAGRENVLNAYEVAVKERYRFFSFGDAMFIKQALDVYKVTINLIILINVSSTDDRGCKCRKTAGEESPGFTGQDAG